jgi:hypothetical protein
MIALRRFMIGRIVVLAAAVLLCLPMVARAEQPVKGTTLGRRQLGLATFGGIDADADGLTALAGGHATVVGGPNPRNLARRSRKARKHKTSAPGTSTDEAPAAADDDAGEGDDKSNKPEKQEESSGSEAAGGDEAPARPRRRARIKLEGEADEDIAATAAPAETSAGSRWLELALGGRGFTRDLRYKDQVTPGLREYQLPFGPAAALDLAFYPLALLMQGPGANIGIVGQFEQLLGTASTLNADDQFPSGATFPTSMHELSGGLRYRVPVAPWQIGIEVTGGEHAFWFTSGGGADRNQLSIPNTIYRFARAGLDARVAVTPEFSLSVGAGYRYVINHAGPISADFPHLTVAGVDADVGAAYAITRSIEVRLQGGVRRYFYDMHSVRGDQQIAGGAVDQYLSGAAMLAVTLDRSP